MKSIRRVEHESIVGSRSLNLRTKERIIFVSSADSVDSWESGT